MKYQKANIYHLIAVFSLFIIQFSILNSQDTWIRTYQPFGNDVSYEVEDIRICPDSGYAVIGTILIDDWDRDGFMMKTDSDGNLLWANIDSVDFIPDPQPSGFVVLEDGSFITAGNHYWWNGNYLTKRNPIGETEWTIELDSDYSIYAIELTNDGNMITTGSSMEGPVNLQKYDIDGNLVWRGTYLPIGFEYGAGLSVIQTSDNGYALTGAVHGDNNHDLLVINTNSTGDSLWSRTFNGSENYRDIGNCIIENSENELLVGGYINENAIRDYYGYLIKMNSIGDTIWTRKFDTNYETSSIYSLLEYETDQYIIRSTKLLIIDNNQDVVWDSELDWDLTYGYATGDRSFQKLLNNQYICIGEKNINGSSIVISKTDSTGNIVKSDNLEILPVINYIKCFPNPFSSSISISFSTMNQNEGSRIEIYNIKGQKVDQLQILNYESGINTITWNAGNRASGIYFIQFLQDNVIKDVEKVLIIK